VMESGPNDQGRNKSRLKNVNLQQPTLCRRISSRPTSAPSCTVSR
jgi:hypothetical protein